ncbi:HORMA domain-containing protein 1-like [Polymixia lowei]
MSCVQRSRAAQAQDTQILPSVVATEQQSLVVVKKLLAIAVSSITYLRGLFPEKAYGTKYVEEQKVMILREELSCPGANQIVQWMQGCFDAIQRKYLRTVVLSIYTDPDNPQKVTELYQFKIQYTAKGPQMDFESSFNKVASVACTNTKKASILLVRKLYTLMQNLGPLPDNVCLNMKLSYYDHVTPQDYQPPGFKEGDSDIMEFEKEPVKLTMGEVVTPFHTLKVDVMTERERLDQVQEEEHVCVRDKWVMKMEEESFGSQSHMMEDVEKPDYENSYLDTEIQLSCHEEIEGCEDVTEMDTLVKRTGDMEVALKRGHSGRVLRSMTEKLNAKEITNQPSPIQEKEVSQFEFPNSQEVPPTSVPKKRKFSEPKERY